MRKADTLELMENIHKMDEEGLSSREIAEKVGKSLKCVQQYIRETRKDKPEDEKPYQNELVFQIVKHKGKVYRDVTALYTDCGTVYRRSANDQNGD